jgi:hypothetical protein
MYSQTFFVQLLRFRPTSRQFQTKIRMVSNLHLIALKHLESSNKYFLVITIMVMALV